MDLPTAVLLVVLVALGVMIVIVLEHRLSLIRRRKKQGPAPEAVEPGAYEDAVSIEVDPAVIADEPEPEAPPDRELRPIEPVSHVLMQADTELAFLTTVQLDPPWLECTFEPTRAFGSVKQLFDRELELLEHSGGTFDQAAFVEQWQRIFGAGLWIRVDPVDEHISQFLLHVHPDGTARLRYG